MSAVSMFSPTKKKILRGSAANTLQMLLSFSISLIVPPFLVHHMPQAEYSAWVLILQISAYINYLEFGIQTAIGKFVAEYQATGDTQATLRLASTAFSILCAGAVVGIAGMAVMALELPRIFHQMPADIIAPVRVGILAIGWSTALTLPFTVLQAAFVGLQRYAVPAIITSVGRITSSVSLVVLLLLHGTLAEMSLLIAGFNLLTIVAQWACWKRYASTEVPLRIFLLDRNAASRLAEYCGVLAVWTLGSLLISGIDTTIVGRYDFKNTGFYGVAASGTNFMILIVGNVVGPLMPAISSMQGQRTASQLGSLLIRTTRYTTLLVMVLGLPLLLGGYPLLRFWLGKIYAAGSVSFFEILVLANVLRQFGYPYAMMVVATGSQRLATLSPVVEAAVNLLVSFVLVHSMGARGVAIGTLVGAIAGLSIHLLVSMRLTMPVIAADRLRLLLQGVMRPVLCALPTLLLLPWFRSRALLPLPPLMLVAWAAATVSIAWFFALNLNERQRALILARRLL